MIYSECCFNVNNQKKVCLYLTEQCNFKCSYCFSNCKENNYKIFSATEIEKLISVFKKQDISHIILSGGEPLLYKEIYTIIKKLHRENFSLSLCTNAMLATEEVCKKLYTAGLKKVTISLDEITEPEFELITKVKDSYLKVVQGIKNFVSNSFEVTLSSVIYNPEYSNFDKIISFAKTLGVNQVCFTLPVCKSKNKIVFEDDLVRDIYNHLNSLSKSTDIAIEFNNPMCNSEDCPSSKTIFGVDVNANIGECLVKHFLRC